MRRFSSTLSSAKVPRPWGTWAMPRRTIASAGALVMSLPSNTIEPERSIIPETARIVVVLPAPLAPSTTTTSPPPTVRSISWSTLTAPYPARTPLSSRSAVTIAPLRRAPASVSEIERAGARSASGGRRRDGLRGRGTQALRSLARAEVRLDHPGVLLHVGGHPVGDLAAELHRH